MMKKKIALLLLLLLVSCFAAFAVNDEDYIPKWLVEDWSGDRNRDWGIANTLYNVFAPFAFDYQGREEVSPFASADVYGWYNGTFFGLADWEREVCLMDLTTDVQSIRNVATDSILGSVNVYTNTITVTATRDYGFNGSYLYEVSWYIMPYGANALYRVYLKKNNIKYYFAGKKGDADEKWVSVNRYSGDSKYIPKYLNNTYEQVVLEYRDELSSGEYSQTVNELVVNVVDKQPFLSDESDIYDGGEEVDNG
ncbi:hypothetical protein JXB28_01520 [Candidatus Woesearchaeota archaeon]|nr:hypothetical protein [Candidatus Woesearchaeota archaeon]